MIVACVRTGTKYGPEYVARLEAGVARHLRRPHRFVCLTDRPWEVESFCTAVDITRTGLNGWWGKMALFDFAARRQERVLFLDLDTVLAGPLEPLADLEVAFGICGSFTRAAGNLSWPCAYGSCVMSFAPGFGADVWVRFREQEGPLVAAAGHYGDQWVIERLVPAATVLQPVLPEGFFLGYRDLDEVRPPACSLVIFAGKSKPHNSPHQWIADAWKR